MNEDPASSGWCIDAGNARLPLASGLARLDSVPPIDPSITRPLVACSRIGVLDGPIAPWPSV
jgi:hypothetical protein